jgi:hypothetical protein
MGETDLDAARVNCTGHMVVVELIGETDESDQISEQSAGILVGNRVGKFARTILRGQKCRKSLEFTNFC